MGASVCRKRIFRNVSSLCGRGVLACLFAYAFADVGGIRNFVYLGYSFGDCGSGKGGGQNVFSADYFDFTYRADDGDHLDAQNLDNALGCARRRDGAGAVSCGIRRNAGGARRSGRGVRRDRSGIRRRHETANRSDVSAADASFAPQTDGRNPVDGAENNRFGRNSCLNVSQYRRLYAGGAGVLGDVKIDGVDAGCRCARISFGTFFSRNFQTCREVEEMRLENVGKCYGDRRVLDHIDLQLEEGKICAVLGESGAGKTTLLNAIMGMTDYEGTVDGVGGHRPVVRRDCSYLFQFPKLLPNLTAEENIAFVLKDPSSDRIAAMLEKVGLKGKERAYPHQLSGGERQRVCIARAFLYPHKLLLMDEPFSSLDLSLKKSLSELVYDLWTENRETILFVTHDVHDAAMLAHRAVVLSRGRVIADEALDMPFPRNFLEHGEKEEKLVRILLADHTETAV